MEKQKRTTKLTLDVIPKVDSRDRAMLINSLTELDIYKLAVGKNAALGFSTEELNAIEEKYKGQRGLFNEDIQNEINKKGWLLKPTTIKQYIQRDQLPMPKERKKVKGKGAVSLYPLDFMRHLNFVRFMLNAGRETFISLLVLISTAQALGKISDHSFIRSMHHCEEIYDSDDNSSIIDDYCDEIEGNISFLDSSVMAGLNCLIEDFKTAINILDGQFERVPASEHRLKILEKIKEKLRTTKNIDDDFFNTIKLRLNEDISELYEIKKALEDSSRKLKDLIAETKKALWT
ncbi:MAG: hypothetical protein DWB56_10235 [Candidatus Jettenia sp.]|uniref:Uncharacterized protein n=1 Tax=Candidatus Jettenia caeni TaxID=247490 RepID=I3IL10_9BACT|nr:hypothetical protein [Candidatus Jettenia sp. AMX1]MBC6929322.1 hypothetical protein [Candidatus Jettenia sp.]NUN22728.1 hypothetical protein [Candidatus Jettenia caeni]KAA0249665.1 MAG: hypothetical protein EDM77_07925 [Candidatus Jettenia sp. AMX1]MCE7880765.1 hypothetical protein [Candidatus Jettenia sp. AMX1]MCQ3927553.1 hypothetical protein [Candidatus Jettenia sp.]